MGWYSLRLLGVTPEPIQRGVEGRCAFTSFKVVSSVGWPVPVPVKISAAAPPLKAVSLESWMGSVGFNGLLWNIVRLNQPNANLMPISQKHRASHVNRAVYSKIPQITQKNAIFVVLRDPRPCQRPRISPAYMTLVTRTHAIPHNARCTPHITRTHVTQHNPCGTNVCHLHKSLDGSCYGLGSDLN